MARASDDDRQATTVRLPQDLLADLDREARARDLSRNQAITAACRSWVTPEDEQARDRT